jgi:hypothetical protein
MSKTNKPRTKPSIRKKKIHQWILDLGPGWQIIGYERLPARIHTCEACPYPSIKNVFTLFHESSHTQLKAGSTCIEYLCTKESVKAFSRDLRSRFKRLTDEIAENEVQEQALEKEARALPEEIRTTQGTNRDLEAEHRDLQEAVRKLRGAAADPELDSLEYKISELEGETEFYETEKRAIEDQHAERMRAIRAEQRRLEAEHRAIEGEHRKLEESIALKEKRQRHLAALATANLAPSGRVAGQSYAVQRHRYGNLWYYWVNKRPVKPSAQFYRADLRTSCPDGYCKTQDEAIAACREIMERVIRGEPYSSMKMPSDHSFLPETE